MTPFNLDSLVLNFMTADAVKSTAEKKERKVYACINMFLPSPFFVNDFRAPSSCGEEADQDAHVLPEAREHDF